jgi:hypothetical protein
LHFNTSPTPHCLSFSIPHLPPFLSHPPNSTTTQVDRHTQLASLLLTAEKSSDSLERILAVSRSLFLLLTDIFRPGRTFQDTPVVILGQHYLSHRELTERWKGDPTRVYLQEICAYDPNDGPTVPSKYTEDGKSEVAKLALRLAPVCHSNVKKEGSSMLGGGASVAYIECAFQGEGSISFKRHAERYTFTLPSIIFSDPTWPVNAPNALAALTGRVNGDLDGSNGGGGGGGNDDDGQGSCIVDIDGTIVIKCRDTGLEGELQFKSFKDHKVKGHISRLAGEGYQKVAKIQGTWDGQVMVESLENEASGILFDAADFQPPLPYPLTVNLAEPGPRSTTRWWSAILEALLYTTPASSVGGGEAKKKAGDLVAYLPILLKRSLMYEVADKGGNSNKAELEGEAAVVAAADRRPLPPTAKMERAKGRMSVYQLHYRVAAVPTI